MLDIMAIGRTHQGMVRSNNEDSFCVDKELGLFMVADGMGGHASGEVASKMAVEIIKETFENSLKNKDVPLVGRMDPELSTASNRLLSSIRFANRAIFEMSQKGPEYYGMGTTLVGLLAQSDHMIQVHVGDSRIYRLRSGQVTQLTEDHSLVLHQVKLGLLTEEEARASRAKNVITRAIGVLRDVEVDVQVHEWIEGDVYVLCSDGLSDLLSADEIGQVLEYASMDLPACSEALIQMALDRGGHDNVTVVLVRLGRMKHRMRGLRGTIGRIFRGHAEA